MFLRFIDQLRVLSLQQIMLAVPSFFLDRYYSVALLPCFYFSFLQRPWQHLCVP
eukprot:c10867_g1_i1 orf=133-294(+)